MRQAVKSTIQKAGSKKKGKAKPPSNFSKMESSKRDMQDDAKKGIVENSPRDQKMDAAMMGGKKKPPFGKKQAYGKR
jgi:hypothetical protein